MQISGETKTSYGLPSAHRHHVVRYGTYAYLVTKAGERMEP